MANKKLALYSQRSDSLNTAVTHAQLTMYIKPKNNAMLDGKDDKLKEMITSQPTHKSVYLLQSGA